MREHLYRGKDEKTGEWRVGGFTLDAADNPRITTKDPSGGGLLFHFVIPETVGEYMGLEDKNGVKIFEEDIVQFDYAGITHRGKIIYQTSECEWGVCCPETMGYQSINSLLRLFISFEVIGNIHDNSELI